MISILKELWAHHIIPKKKKKSILSMPCLLMDRKFSQKNKIDFIHLGFHSPLHNHHLANTSLREIITLMKIKYNLKFTFIFIYIIQAELKLKWGHFRRSCLPITVPFWLTLVSCFLLLSYLIHQCLLYELQNKNFHCSDNAAFLMSTDTWHTW